MTETFAEKMARLKAEKEGKKPDLTVPVIKEKLVNLIPDLPKENIGKTQTEILKTVIGTSTVPTEFNETELSNRTDAVSKPKKERPIKSGVSQEKFDELLARIEKLESATKPEASVQLFTTLEVELIEKAFDGLYKSNLKRYAGKTGMMNNLNTVKLCIEKIVKNTH